ncbi:hypothetical protein [Alkalihalobacillus sp. 1P02AB]|uniref:hypothetical protein n=1 Tax=Alkalihalobacillus sp. 1P02AB TaxID=3132260 RepID=UPI0039A4CABC
MLKKWSLLQQVVEVLDENKIDYSLGGSGLLYALGLSEQVNDWDLMVEASEHELVKILEKKWITPQKKKGDSSFGSDYVLQLNIENVTFEFIGHFSIYYEQQLIQIPNEVSFVWNGVKVANPVAWYVAYELMARKDKADSLYYYLKAHKSDNSVHSKWFEQALPNPILKKLTELN